VLDFTVEPDSPLTTWGQVHRHLRHRLENREFGVGVRLPSETVLAQDYGVSRATIRKAISTLAEEGFLDRRRGAGTFVVDREDRVACDVDLLRPWREQLLAGGHAARSRLIRFRPRTPLPPELRELVHLRDSDELDHGLHVQEVDGMPIAVTESWIPARTDAQGWTARLADPVLAHGLIRPSSAAGPQVELLNTYPDAPLVEVVTYSRLRESGNLVELARTRWLASRVRCTYSRTLRWSQIDMSELAPPAR
jgi:GntR family transcriptional regulator